MGTGAIHELCRQRPLQIKCSQALKLGARLKVKSLLCISRRASG